MLSAVLRTSQMRLLPTILLAHSLRRQCSASLVVPSSLSLSLSLSSSLSSSSSQFSLVTVSSAIVVARQTLVARRSHSTTAASLTPAATSLGNCGGCGVELQNETPDRAGYLPLDVDKYRTPSTPTRHQRSVRSFELQPGELEHLEREFETLHGPIDRSTAEFDPDALLRLDEVPRQTTQPKPICQRCYSLRHYGRLLSVDMPLNSTIVVRCSNRSSLFALKKNFFCFRFCALRAGRVADAAAHASRVCRQAHRFV